MGCSEGEAGAGEGERDERDREGVERDDSRDMLGSVVDSP